jgi:hypothetical protein
MHAMRVRRKQSLGYGGGFWTNPLRSLMAMEVSSMRTVALLQQVALITFTVWGISTAKAAEPCKPVECYEKAMEQYVAAQELTGSLKKQLDELAARTSELAALLEKLERKDEEELKVINDMKSKVETVVDDNKNDRPTAQRISYGILKTYNQNCDAGHVYSNYCFDAMRRYCKDQKGRLIGIPYAGSQTDLAFWCTR